MLTIVNPIGTPVNGPGTGIRFVGPVIQGAYGLASLGGGAVVGTALGRSLGLQLSQMLAGIAGGGSTMQGVSRLLVHGLVGIGVGMIPGLSSNSAVMTNLRSGIQAGIAATGVLGAMDDFTGGQASGAVASLETTVTAPLSGYVPSNFNANTPSLTSVRTGNQYIGKQRVGAAYGGAATDPMRLNGYRDDSEFYSAAAYA